MSRKIATAVLMMIVLTGCRLWQQSGSHIARSAARFVLAPLVYAQTENALTQSSFRNRSVVAPKTGSDEVVAGEKTQCAEKHQSEPAIDNLAPVRVERTLIRITRNDALKTCLMRYEEQIVVTASSARS